MLALFHAYSYKKRGQEETKDINYCCYSLFTTYYVCDTLCTLWLSSCLKSGINAADSVVMPYNFTNYSVAKFWQFTLGSICLNNTLKSQLES